MRSPDFTVELAARLTEAGRLKDYRERKGDEYREHNAARMRDTRAKQVPLFVGVDSEGIGREGNHRAVLLGVGEQQYVARDIRAGLQWDEVFRFLYERFVERPRAVYVGFFLGYDFNQWLKTLPLRAARKLLTKQGKAARVKRNGHGSFPVQEGEWEFDMLGFKRLSIRPRDSGLPWMHVCDAGSFFQTAFVNVLDPANWANDPDGPPCSMERYNNIVKWKDKRGSFVRITKGMRAYNVEENLLLAECMTRLAKGFLSVGIRLGRAQWYGPGATSKKWMHQKGIPKRRGLPDLGVPDWFLTACRKSYFGGWFEIFSHGKIGGQKSRFWNYDINNAYPYATTKLPHLCENARYNRGDGVYDGGSDFVLLYATVLAKSNRIGPVPHRNSAGNILRPGISRGWYWKSEVDAAQRAMLVKEVVVHEWVSVDVCSHPCPFEDISVLYDLRLSVGKKSAQGMAIKLNNNSIYGNLAQKAGAAPYNNWFYASYITSHCRTQILDAIASHPSGIQSCLMVATDGVCFDSRHPSLPTSKLLGEWEETQYKSLVLFKPGVYWTHEGEEALLQVKSRGVPKAQFIEGMDKAYGQFLLFKDYLSMFRYDKPAPDNGKDFIDRRGWPHFLVELSFSMKTCKQALNEGNWDNAGAIRESVPVLQSSDPSSKRTQPFYNIRKDRIDTIIHSGDSDNPETYYHGDVVFPCPPDLGYNLDGRSPYAQLKEEVQEALNIREEEDAIILHNVPHPQDKETNAAET